MSKDTNIWSNNLKRIRKHKGYSQKDIQDSCNIGQTTLSAIELGRISGRNHIEVICKALRATPKEVFPYYDYLTFEESARELGIPRSIVIKRIKENNIKYYQKGDTKFLRRSDLQLEVFKEKVKPSIRITLINILENNTNGYSSPELLEFLGPFSSKEVKDRTRRSLQSILSRSKEFIDDRSTSPSTWKLNKEITNG